MLPAIKSPNRALRKAFWRWRCIREDYGFEIFSEDDKRLYEYIYFDCSHYYIFQCAPIVSSTIEKVLRIPVAIIMPKDSLFEAIELARKMG